MAILAIFTGVGFTKDMYDALIKEVGWKESKPKGGVIHVASFDDAGDIHVADVWESAEDLNNFVSAHLMPAMQKLGVPAPKVDVYQVYNIDAYQAVRQYEVD